MELAEGEVWPPDGALGLAQQIVFVVEGRAPQWAKLVDWYERDAQRRKVEAWIAGKIREWAARRATEV
jgi:hypothetical protein